jgi:hypothetical protein
MGVAILHSHYRVQDGKSPERKLSGQWIPVSTLHREEMVISNLFLLLSQAIENQMGSV